MNGDPGKSDGSVDATHNSYRTLFTAAGKPVEISACSNGSCDQDVAISCGFVGNRDGAGGTAIGEAADSVNSTNYNGCINVGTAAVDTDNSLACNVTGVAASVAQPMVDAVRAHFAADALTTIVGGSTKSTHLSFTDGSTIYTAHNF